MTNDIPLTEDKFKIVEAISSQLSVAVEMLCL